MKKTLLIILMILAISVIFILPQLPVQKLFDDSSESLIEADNSNEISQSRIAEKTKYRKDAQLVLEKIVDVRDLLKSKSIEKWNAEKFNIALENISIGDDLYREGEYLRSIKQYREALDQLNNLKEDAAKIIESTIISANNNIEKLDSELTVEQTINSINLAFAIDKNNESIKLLKERSLKLPDLFNKVMQSDQFISEQKYEDAFSVLSEAIMLDPYRKKTKTSMENLNKQIKEKTFIEFMSEGFEAMDQNNFSSARKVFNEALKTYPERPDINDALNQLESRESSFQIKERIKNAEANESLENWSEAKKEYEALLESDNSLVSLKARLINVRIRAELDEQLENLINNPLTLRSDELHQKAKKLLKTAQGINQRGAKLEKQIESVSKIIVQARNPIPVNFFSDNKTKVTIFKIGSLGLFEKRTIELVPGKYVALGQRIGFRDVRLDFAIEPNEVDKNISIMCVESI
ncbi:MAG: hypothetical protein CMK23_05000 [Porticoccaceae bacterium]|nr:hypothetical protein [Porticoccaceae bacterium]